MTQINGVTVAGRHNRPSVNQAVLLEAHFINDGLYQDPFDISGVTIFKKIHNQSPSSLLTSSNVINTSAVSSVVQMHFGVSDSGVVGLAESTYTQGAAASGVYKLDTGKFAVVLDGTVSLSGYYDFDGAGFKQANEASAAIRYLDVWTVKMFSNSDWTTYIHQFDLYDNTFLSVTQPLLLKPKNTLHNKRIELGSKIDLKIGTEISVMNKDVDEAVKNIFKDSVITSAAVEITKLNSAPGLDSRFTVSAYADTSSTVSVTSDNTIIWNWNTDNLTNIGPANSTFGSLTGEYEVRVKYTLLNETHFSPPFYLVVK
jgi:hypothetical protein